MPGKYKFKSDDDGYDSGYESEGGTAYNPKKVIGKGCYSQARQFKSRNGKIKAVLNPVKDSDIDFQEVQAKYNFFNTLYPGQGAQLIKIKGTYRLVLPMMPGIPYVDLKIKDTKQHAILFLSAIAVLKECHAKGLVVVDFKEDNILFDSRSGKSYLIDGGLSAKTGMALHKLFIKRNYSELIVSRRKHDFYAPECFSLKKTLASERMDTYALGSMMKTLLEDDMLDEISEIIETCLKSNPEDRPTLEQLEIQLNELLYEARQEINSVRVSIKAIEVNFNQEKTENRVNGHKERLLALTKLVSQPDDTLEQAYKLLGKGLQKNIEKLVIEKQKEINHAADMRCKEITIANLKLDKHMLGFKNKITEMKRYNNKHYREVCVVAETFYKGLVQAKLKFLRARKPFAESKKEFQEKCLDLINTARPQLEELREWKEALISFLADCLAVFNIKLSSKLGLFAPKTESVKKLDDLRIEMLAGCTY